MNWPDIRTALIQRRKDLGWSQFQVAVMLETTQNAVSRMELGHIREPQIGTVIRWARVLGIDIGIRIAKGK